MKKVVYATTLLLVCFSSYSQTTNLKCLANGIFKHLNGESIKLEQSTINVTLEVIKGTIYIDIDGNSDYSMGINSKIFINSDKSYRYEGKDLSDESKYFVTSKIFKLPSNTLYGENYLTLNRLSGTINYRTKLYKNNTENYSEQEVFGDCTKVSNVKKF